MNVSLRRSEALTIDEACIDVADKFAAGAERVRSIDERCIDVGCGVITIDVGLHRFWKQRLDDR